MALKPEARSLLGLLALVLAVMVAQGWWKQHHRDSIGAEVAALARDTPIRMMTSDNCAVCDQARRWLTEQQVAFTECSIERDEQCRADFEASRSPGTPVLVLGVGPGQSRLMLGFSPERLRDTLAKNPS